MPIFFYCKPAPFLFTVGKKVELCYANFLGRIPIPQKSWKSNGPTIVTWKIINDGWIAACVSTLARLLDTSSLDPKIILHRFEMNVLRRTQRKLCQMLCFATSSCPQPTKRQQKPPGWTPRPQQWLENDFATWNPGRRKNVESNGLKVSLPRRNLAPPRRVGKMIVFSYWILVPD